MGRQPWVVYGLLRTSDALSRSVTAGQVLFSLILFAFVYALLLVLFLFLLNRKIHHGPEWHAASQDENDNDMYSKRIIPVLDDGV